MPFAIDEFLAVFAAYNAAIWPFQIVAYGLGLVVAFALVAQSHALMRLGFAGLAVLWAVNGIGYHMIFFAPINPVAPVFAASFVLQAVLLLASAIQPGDLRLRRRWGFRFVAGLMTIVYALAIYPVLGLWAGHGLMAGPMFGVAPCPTTIFTIGILMIAHGRWVVWLSTIPILWSLIGLSAAVQLGIPEDLGMPIAGALLAALLAAAFWQGRATR
ncbi:DUF6064 family protein [Rhodovulum steppense]|jgi:hypothetical protein|uniref:Uncharacterized protein n=1 Tax=Rhodovulum steppense TaxID=540251 RepID=A0A4R1YM09_9RHOB|nr:DUF6064 family protein [Rhodovulum steppense]TCM78082.1 hypothetical protein EV216_12723 [Rhodovulum steppense]